MSPREKHIPDDAERTSVCFTAEDRAVIHWIKEVRKGKNEKRATINDIVVDGLTALLEKEGGKTREQIQAMVPAAPAQPTPKVMQMPKPKKKR